MSKKDEADLWVCRFAWVVLFLLIVVAFFASVDWDEEEAAMPQVGYYHEPVASVSS